MRKKYILLFLNATVKLKIELPLQPENILMKIRDVVQFNHERRSNIWGIWSIWLGTYFFIQFPINVMCTLKCLRFNSEYFRTRETF